MFITVLCLNLFFNFCRSSFIVSVCFVLKAFVLCVLAFTDLHELGI